jgi:hypothetical protein
MWLAINRELDAAAAELPHNVRLTPKETLTAKGVFHFHFELIEPLPRPRTTSSS